jgi:hypothetical protein
MKEIRTKHSLEDFRKEFIVTLPLSKELGWKIALPTFPPVNGILQPKFAHSRPLTHLGFTLQKHLALSDTLQIRFNHY